MSVDEILILFVDNIYIMKGVNTMTEVFSIRVPRELKRQIEELKDMVNWREEVVSFLYQRVRYYNKLRTIKEVHEILERHPSTPPGTAARLVREDRDSH